jgi:signal transduction histidine kinase
MATARLGDTGEDRMPSAANGNSAPRAHAPCATDSPDALQQVDMLRQQLAQAQRMAMLGELVGTTTHEFNNVLTTILNYARLGLRHKDNATREKAFQKILSASERAARITQGVLALARKRSTGFEPTLLAPLVEDTLLLLERELHKYHIAVEKYFHDTPPVLANPHQVQQVLMNLLINARQAMPEGGRVILKIFHDQAAGTVDVVVRDTGCGISPDKLPRIFDPYFTTKTGPDAEGKGGTGLGLALCREIIEAHRGRIRVESTPGKGTSFTLKFPIMDPSSGAAPPAPGNG